MRNDLLLRRLLYEHSNTILPSEYQEVTYIESNYNHLIVLDYIVNIEDEIHLKYEDMDVNFDIDADNHLVFASDGTYGVWFDYDGYNTHAFKHIYARFGMSSSFHMYYTTYSGNCVLKKNYLELNENKYLIGTSSTMPNINLKLFGALRPNGEIHALSKFKLLDFYIIRNGVEQLHLVPCYRKSDNKTGLYDIINQKFYQNYFNEEFNIGDKV